MPSDDIAQNVSFPSNGATAHGYLALPPQGSGPGLVVIQEWWGLTSHIVDVTDRLAAEGFVALAPDLYGGRTTHDADEAAQMMQSLPEGRAARDLAGAVDLLLGHEAVTSTTVGAVGFCMGGGFVLTMAAQQGDRVSAAVPFYGVVGDPLPDFSSMSAHVLGHFGLRDESVPPERVRELATKIEAESARAPEVHFYDAGHAFFNDDREGVYSPADAALAWERTITFLRTHLH